ncbi:MAG: hypothetical protein JW943_09070 [Deltaproteobacteria bacterium]|nr:hypothetical protein [Deltaproteobacteria bacterium]
MAMENPARCIIRTSFSQERMTYMEAKDGRSSKNFPTLEWMVPPMAGVKYYGSNSPAFRRISAGETTEVRRHRSI